LIVGIASFAKKTASGKAIGKWVEWRKSSARSSSTKNADCPRKLLTQQHWRDRTRRICLSIEPVLAKQIACSRAKASSPALASRGAREEH
jgi:hypothetical protein